MGKAIILTDSDFSAFNLGRVNRLVEAILPAVVRITSATVFRVERDNMQLPDVSWSISDNTVASLVSNGDGTCTVTPLVVTTVPIVLTASFTGGELSRNFLATRDYLNITSLLSPYFLAQKSIGEFSSNWATSNTKRCCVPAILFSTIGIDITEYTEIQITFKNGYDYVFGTGPEQGSSITGWQGWDGDTGGQAFSWITDNQKATATVDSSVLAMSLNLRYDDNTTEFSSSTKLTDLVDSILLVV